MKIKNLTKKQIVQAISSYPNDLAKFKLELTIDTLRIHATDELWPLLRDKVFNDLQPQRLEVSAVEIWKAGRLWSRGSIELWYL